MWYKLPDKLQMIIAKSVIIIGKKTNTFKLTLWGMTHYPMVIVDEEEHENS